MGKQTQKNFWLTAKTAEGFDRCYKTVARLSDRPIKQGELADAVLSWFMSLSIEEQRQIVADWFAGRFRP